MESPSLRCPCCQLDQHPLYCASCLREGIALHNELLSNLQTRIDSIVSQSARLLESGSYAAGPSREKSRGVGAWRELKAEVADRERRCAGLRSKIAEKEIATEDARNRAAQSAVHQRRETLSKVKASSSPATYLQQSINRARLGQQDATLRIIHARQVLVREAVAVFGLRKRPSGEWEIAGLVLPEPEQFRLHSSYNINAALLHTIHLLSLVTSYLAIDLPYLPLPPPPLEKPHIGRPLIKPSLPFVSTTKWRDKHVLWMSSTASIASKLKTRGEPPSSAKLLSNPTIAGIIAKSSSKQKQFLTSFALLAFSVAYLAWSQDVPGVGIKDADELSPTESDDETRSRPQSCAAPDRSAVLISATSILHLIHATALSPTLGHKSHAPGGTRQLGHLGFGLDVAKVVGTVLKAEEGKWGGRRGNEGEVLSEGWDMLDNGGI
ncbi:hypothetical protein I350_07681 [Cryptococcus amylolentus CBS 6273]|uniref:Autophagy-related protein 14 n=1 Tax=Cryptococcus amylolentus CBS 6273 TaxID=1296118 RepID=A0A1E3JB14_9TREE|nr:hypothetical protein I350_07681 [Cryptococcus amylolentus CBS 6273]